MGTHSTQGTGLGLPNQVQMFEALSHGEAYGRPGVPVDVIETFISRVHLLPGQDGQPGDVYKVKKELDWGWIDYSSLEKRRLSCEKEIFRNARNAPGVYLGVSPIKLTSDGIRLTDRDEGQVLDYAVHMRRLPNESSLSVQIMNGLDLRIAMPEVSSAVARMHQGAELLCGDRSSSFAYMEKLESKINDNASIVDRESVKLGILDQSVVRDLAKTSFTRLYQRLYMRASTGGVRVCHGDLHTGNIWFDQERTVLLDGVEYNDDNTTLDVMQDLAFLGLEFMMQEKPALSDLLFRQYSKSFVEYSDDVVYQFYLAERLLFKAKLILTLDVPDAQQSGDANKIERQMKRARIAVNSAKAILESLTRI